MMTQTTTNCSRPNPVRRRRQQPMKLPLPPRPPPASPPPPLSLPSLRRMRYPIFSSTTISRPSSSGRSSCPWAALRDCRAARSTAQRPEPSPRSCPPSAPRRRASAWRVGSETRWWPARCWGRATGRSRRGRPALGTSGRGSVSPARRSACSWTPFETSGASSTSEIFRRRMYLLDRVAMNLCEYLNRRSQHKKLYWI